MTDDLKELDRLVAQLHSDDTDPATSLILYERIIKQSKHVIDALNQYNNTVKVLTNDAQAILDNHDAS